MSGKVSIIEAVKNSVKSHYMVCNGTYPICLGGLDQFQMDLSGDVDVLVLNRMVYHLIHCPSNLHDSVAGSLGLMLFDSLRKLEWVADRHFHLEGECRLYV